MAYSASSIFFCMVMIMIMMVAMPSSSGAQQPLDEVVKGCPFTAMYSFGATAPPTDDTFLTVVDYLASSFHLPSPNSYINKDVKFEYGINFARSGATSLKTSFFHNNDIEVPSNTNTKSLDVQLDHFEAYLHSHCSSSHHDCGKKLKESIFLVEIGANDYNYAFFQGKPIKEVSAYVPHVVQSIKNALERLIHVGAVNLVVPGNLPMGCLPSYLTMFQSDDPMRYDSKKCLRSFNTFATLHNDHIWQALSELRVKHPHVHVVYADYYNAFMALLHNHVLLGFEKGSLSKACCGSGGLYNFDPTKACGSGSGVTVCSNPTKYVHWDGIQLTQEAYKYMVEGFISGNFINPKFKLPERWHCSM